MDAVAFGLILGVIGAAVTTVGVILTVNYYKKQKNKVLILKKESWVK